MAAKPQSSSRQHKLLALLETGSSDATRKAAAKQIADIARAHPDQLLATVVKIHAYLYHKSWETRVAAGEAIAYLADAFPHHTVDDLREQALTCGVPLEQLPNMDVTPLSFSSFNLQHVLERGTVLGASGGQEFDLVLDPSLTLKARLAAQKEGLKKRLGLDKDMGLNADELFGDEDFEAAEEVCSVKQALAGRHSQAKQAAQELLVSMTDLARGSATG